MRKGLRWRVALCLVVFVVFGAIGVYPLMSARFDLPQPTWLKEHQLMLGLDLKGGVHLVLRVRTDEALRFETESAMERLREDLLARMISVGASAPDPTHFRIEGVPARSDAAFRDVAASVAANFDRVSGTGGTYVFTMRPQVQTALREDAVARNRENIERRVNELGVSEPSIAQQGRGGDRIFVQLPGVTDLERARTIIRSPGFLEFKLVEEGPATARDTLLVGGQVPDGSQILVNHPAAESGGDLYYRVRNAAIITGKDLRTARPTLDENNQPAVGFTLNRDGATRFAKATGDNVGRSLAIVLDQRIQSVARIDSRIASEGRIFGSFTTDEVQNLSLILRSGALSAPMDTLEEKTVGPSLGADSIRAGMIASLVGLGLVVTFMLGYYRWSGANAVIALGFNLVILLGLMAYLGAAMTLPGIAGFVLTMGVGVDSNVLIFERIKEELEAKRGVRASIDTGFKRVFWTLFDTHIAALISCAFLFQFGTGPIRGFATTLCIGLLSNLFTSIFVSKTIFDLALAWRRRIDTLSI